MIERPDLKTLCILHYPDARLRVCAQTLPERDTFRAEMAARMQELMAEARGLGLAATQVGWPFRLVLVSPEHEEGRAEAYINPVIIARDFPVLSSSMRFGSMLSAPSCSRT